MYLSRLDLHGFKSFAKKTALHFDPGVTAIVGPNGCGKSNVIDAVRWVLGEQRARLLRSDKMESVIFNGTSSKRALGMAEVALTVENTRGVLPTEYSEVTVARRLFRSGESEYLLNGTVCRLRDILDLFMDTGLGAGAYSVIELKMIEDILSENAADRRRLFEEAAGVTKYKLRRRQTLGKLDAAQADLTRLRDLTDEVERQVNSLRRQAKKAERHARLSSRLHALEIALAAFEHERLAEEHARLQGQDRSEGMEVQALTTQLARYEATLAEHRTALVDQEQALAEVQRTANAHAAALGEQDAQRRLAAERAQAGARALARIAREDEDDQTRRAQTQASLQSLQERREGALKAEQEADSAEAAAEQARDEAAATAEAHRGALETAQRHARETALALTQARAALGRLHDRRALLKDELERSHLEADTVAEQARAARDQADASGAAATHAQAEADAARTALQEAEAAREQAQADLEGARQALRTAERSRDALAAEVALLQGLVRGYEDAPAAVGYLAEQPGFEPQTVADLLAADEALGLALDAALGDRAGWIVVDTDADVARAAQALKTGEAGRATFVVLDRLVVSSEPEPAPAGTTPLADLVRAAPGFEALVATLLQGCFLAHSLAEAQRLAAAHPHARFVTQEGEWARGGLRHAGGKATARPALARLGRRERLAELEAELGQAEAALADAQEAVARAEAALQELGFDAARTALRTAEAAHAQAAREAARADAQAEALEARASTLKERIAERTASLETLDDPAELEATLVAVEADAETAEAERAAAEATYRETDAEARAAAARLGDRRLRALQARTAREALDAEADRARQTLADLDRRAEARDAEREALKAEIERAQAEASELAAAIEGAQAEGAALAERVQEAEGAVHQARVLIADAESGLRDVRRRREEAQERAQRQTIRLTEITTRQAGLVERLRDDHGIGLEEAHGALDKLQAEELFQPDTARVEVPALREKIRALGAVNALALEHYGAEKERLAFLREQQADLEQAERSLLDTIDEINTTASARFRDTFEQVQAAFSKLFADLFGDNATATLTLDGDDPLEAPIEITARPKGKKPSTIAQLSGGEKTLTAIALLFAIYLVKPSPFCILDEVDAPLDDANIERFMRLIRSFADSTQFILVTHNKLTMEAADRLYGITMQEPGVSQLVGVRFDDVLEGEAQNGEAVAA